MQGDVTQERCQSYPRQIIPDGLPVLAMENDGLESVFSSIKRMFGEEVRAKRRRNMIQELMLKVSLYNRFVVA